MSLATILHVVVRARRRSKPSHERRVSDVEIVCR
jgi:hypothetical protein